MTAAEWGRRWGNDIDGLIDNVAADIPTLQDVQWREGNEGDTHKFARVTAYPSPEFRAINAAASEDHSTTEQISVTVKVLDCWASVDAAQNDWAEVLADEQEFQVLGSAERFETEIFYGDTDTLAAGFDGINDTLALTDTNCLTAEGDSADAQTSCYFISHGKRRFEGVYGKEGILKSGKPFFNKRKVDGSDASIPEYTMLTSFRPAIAMYRTSDAIGQICNCEPTGTTNTITLELIDQMEQILKGANCIGYLHMNLWLRIKALLRTAGLETGAGFDNSGKWAGAYGKFKFKVSDQVLITEAVKT